MSTDREAELHPGRQPVVGFVQREVEEFADATPAVSRRVRMHARAGSGWADVAHRLEQGEHRRRVLGGVGTVGLVIDGHNDLAWAMRERYGYDLDAVDLVTGVSSLHTDIARLRAGGVSGQFWSVYVPSTMEGGAAVTATLEQVDFVRRMISRHHADLRFVSTADEVEAARADGYIASLMGMEGGHSINQSLAVLRMMYDLGVRYMTLTHNHNTAWADSATDVRVLGGLSDFGGEVIREMNRLGMVIDLSHVSDDVMRQTLALSRAPIMFSHSSARSVCDVVRNVPDDVLRAVAVNGGICMVTLVADLVSPVVAEWHEECQQLLIARGDDPYRPGALASIVRERAATGSVPAATVDDVVAHLEHVRTVAGIEHIGIGGDFDGATLMPIGLGDVSGYPRLWEALRERHWSDDDLDLLTTRNVLRVLRDAELVAAASQPG